MPQILYQHRTLQPLSSSANVIIPGKRTVNESPTRDVDNTVNLARLAMLQAMYPVKYTDCKYGDDFTKARLFGSNRCFGLASSVFSRNFAGFTLRNWMLKSKGRPVQGQISSKYCKIHVRGVVKVSVFIKATLFGRTYRYPRAMFCSQWLFVRHPYGDLYLLFARESLDFSVIVDFCLSKLSYLPLEGVPFF